MREIIADLHIHSPYSLSCSKDISFQNLEKAARKKGVHLLGTGDFSHPKWFEEIKRSLVEVNGIYMTTSGFPFLLQNEINLVYNKDKKSRKVHHVLLAPHLDVVEQINEYLGQFGSLASNGRPTLSLSTEACVEGLKEISPDIEIIPAHIWTPHYGMLGSESGFDSPKECFGDQLKHINAIETGLSSTPLLNKQVKSLSSFVQISNSDAHSLHPWRLGREATVFTLKELTYNTLLAGLRDGSAIAETLEVDPNYGKYHADGHKHCKFSSEYKQTKELNSICPVCKKKMTIGVLHRINDLSDQEATNVPKFRTLLPLSEVLACVFSKGRQTKAVVDCYDVLTADRTEFDVLRTMPIEDITAKAGDRVADALLKNRYGQIRVKPGYDGVYGVPDISAEYYKKEEEVKVKELQTGLGSFS